MESYTDPVIVQSKRGKRFFINFVNYSLQQSFIDENNLKNARVLTSAHDPENHNFSSGCE
jgi:hypothetical protein